MKAMDMRKDNTRIAEVLGANTILMNGKIITVDKMTPSRRPWR